MNKYSFLVRISFAKVKIFFINAKLFHKKPLKNPFFMIKSKKRIRKVYAFY